MVVRRVRCRNRVLVSVGVVVILDPSSHDVVVSDRAGQEQLVWRGPAHFMLPSPGSGSLTVTLALVEVAAAVAGGFLPLGTVGCLDKLLLAFDFFWFDFDFFDQNLSRLASSVAHRYFLYNYLESYWNYTKVSENSLKRRQPLHDTGTPTQQQSIDVFGTGILLGESGLIQALEEENLKIFKISKILNFQLYSVLNVYFSSTF